MENNIKVEEIKSSLLLSLQEQQALQKEINTLNENIDRKNKIITGLYEIIINTKDTELIKLTEKVMYEVNFGGLEKGV